jgi:hypothetical protein
MTVVVLCCTIKILTWLLKNSLPEKFRSCVVQIMVILDLDPRQTELFRCRILNNSPQLSDPIHDSWRWMHACDPLNALHSCLGHGRESSAHILSVVNDGLGVAHTKIDVEW